MARKNKRGIGARGNRNRKTTTSTGGDGGGGGGGGGTGNGGGSGGGGGGGGGSNSGGGGGGGGSNNNNNNNNKTTKTKDSKITQRNIQRFGEKHVRNLQQKQKDFKSVRNKTMSRSDFASKHYGKGYGTTGNVGRSLQTRPETQRELDQIAANVAAQKAAAEAAKKEATRKSMFSTDNRGLFSNYDAQIGGKFATTLADTFAKPKYMYQGNMAGRLPGLSNYFTPDVGTGLPYTKGGRLRGIPFTGGDASGSLTKFKVPKDAKLSRSVLGVRQFKLDPTQMKNLGMGVTDDATKFAAKGLGKYGLRAIPFVGAVPSLVDAGVRLKNKDYTGAGLSALSAVPGKIGWASLAGLAAHDINKSMNVGADTQAATTKAGGLNVGDKASETEGGRNIRSLKNVTDIGDKRDKASDARTNSLLSNAYNISTKIPFIGSQIKNIREDTKPYTDRINVETPKKTKKAISDFIGNLDSMSDTTRRFVNEFATDNPNIPNKSFHIPVGPFAVPVNTEAVADAVQTFNPMNKNYAPQLSTSWGKPLQAIANNFVSGGTKNIFQEAALNTGAEGSISPAEGLSIARQIGTNINTPGTLGNFEATKLKNLADKYGGGTVKPTPGTILRGIRGNSGGTRNQTSRSGTGTGSDISDATTTPEEFIIPEIPQRELPNLQNIQQQAYDQQMSIYGVPNYMAQVQPRQYVKPLQFSQYFNRNKIPKLRNQFA